MDLIKLNGPEITLKTNEKLELAKNAILLTYVILETLYKTILGKYLAVEMERLQCVAGAFLACLLLAEWFRMDKDNKLKWLKRHSFVFLYFVIRTITFFSVGFQYTMLRSMFFEVIYLLVLTELIVDTVFLKKIIIPVYIIINFILNISNTFFYWACETSLKSNNTILNKIYFFAYDYTYTGDLKLFNYSSMYSNPNQFGIMTGLAIIFALCYINKNKTILMRMALYGFILFSLYCLYYSNCSGAQLAMFSVPIAAVILNILKAIKRKQIIILCIIGCLVLSGAFIGYAAYNDEYSYTEAEESFDRMSTWRYRIWKDCYYSHQEEFLLGCGNMTLEKRDRYQYNLDKGIDEGLDIESSLIGYVGPHNGYIGTISCAGILGFLAFLAVILKKIKDSRSLNENYWYLAIVFILVINLFECMMPVSKNFITMYMFMIISMDDREELA